MTDELKLILIELAEREPYGNVGECEFCNPLGPKLFNYEDPKDTTGHDIRCIWARAVKLVKEIE